MKKVLKIGAALLVVTIVAGLYVWFFVYNKPHKDYESAEADFSLSAEVCYNEFLGDTEESGKYLGKILQLYGVPTSIEKSDSTVVVVFAFNSGMFGDEGIRCTMLPNYHSQAVKMYNSKEINIKGYCTGYNGTDVILEHCSIITQ